jgi:hypothetical protein
MLSSDAHLSTKSEVELRIAQLGISKTQGVEDTRAWALDHILFSVNRLLGTVFMLVCAGDLRGGKPM